jgi:hypothetical protein
VCAVNALVSDPELLWLRARDGRPDSGECGDVGDVMALLEDERPRDVFSWPKKCQLSYDYARVSFAQAQKHFEELTEWKGSTSGSQT